MIRNFTLKNSLGATFSLMNAQQGAYFNPAGLGFDDTTEYEQVGEFFAPLTQRFGQQVITGVMVFGAKPYESYLTFTKFCQHSPLSLIYETDAGAFQIPCRLTKIEKGDTDGWTYLECAVEFTALARMYKTVTANNTGTAGGGKVYLAKDLPDITGSIITIDNAEAGEVLNITADIVPVQSGSGTPSPTNVRPISGHTEVDVVVSPTTDAEDGNTYTIALGRTVYGGTLDVLSGELTVTHAIYDLGSLNWNVVSGNNYANFTTDALPDVKYNKTTPNIMCSSYKVGANDTVLPTEDNYVWVNINPRIRIKDTSKASLTAAQFKTAMSGVQLVYELATPLTYQLTPQQVKTILGKNNIFANSGDITITGRKTYGYKYNYTYGDFVADTVTIDSDSVTASPCRISIFGECTNPTWRHYLDGNSVATGYYNGTIPAGHKLVIDTTSSPYSIEEQDISGNLIADRYELCDFSTERFFLLGYGHNTISVSHTDPDSIRLMVEGYIFYETV